MNAWDEEISALRAQLVAALKAEAYPEKANDLAPETRELVQRLFSLDALVRFTTQPPTTPDEHATFYTAQLVFAALLPRSSKTKTEAKRLALCDEVLQAMLAGMTRDDAIEEVAKKHAGERGAGSETIRRAYLTCHKESAYWSLLNLRQRGLF